VLALTDPSEVSNLGNHLRLKSIRFKFAIIAAFANLIAFTPAFATAEKCPTYDFAKIFSADFTTGSHWDNRSGNLKITWSAKSESIYDENASKKFTEKELNWLRAAFQSWDQALQTITFVEVAPTADPQIVIGFVKLNPSTVQLDAMGFWNSWVQDGIRYRATIKLKDSETKWFSKRNQFIRTAQHEIGNVLGLGDISPTAEFVSVLEDPWQPPYIDTHLSDSDIAMVRQLYGESTCGATFTKP